MLISNHFSINRGIGWTHLYCSMLYVTKAPPPELDGLALFVAS